MTTVVFENARLVDPEAGEVTEGWLLVDKGRVEEVHRGHAAIMATHGPAVSTTPTPD